MKKKKIIIVAILAAWLLCINAGCGWNISENMNRYFGISNDGALAYMEEKYGEKFTFIKSEVGMSFSNTRYVYVSCESLPGKEIVVTVVREKGNIETYRDKYMNVYFEDSVDEYISSIANNYFDEFTYRFAIMGTSVLTTYLGMTFDEYLKKEPHYIFGRVKIEDTSEETVYEFVYELKRLGFHLSLTIDILSGNIQYVARYHRDYDDIEIIKRRY
jgi:hypothetical protein